MHSRVARARVRTLAGHMGGQVRHVLATRLARHRAQRARRLAVGNAVGAVREIVRAENESYGPVVVVVAHAVRTLEEFYLEIAVVASGTILDEHTSERSHVTTRAARVLLIVIVVLDDDAFLRDRIVAGLFRVQAVPHFDLLDLAARAQVAQQRVLERRAVPGWTRPEQTTVCTKDELIKKKKLKYVFKRQRETLVTFHHR